MATLTGKYHELTVQADGYIKRKILTVKFQPLLFNSKTVVKLFCTFGKTTLDTDRHRNRDMGGEITGHSALQQPGFNYRVSE